ncbi:MAG: hypothetical protein H7A40_01780 [Chlamydiales bacterium]|nr:hypothetical protein [Chlamydiales bacterium]
MATPVNGSNKGLIIGHGDQENTVDVVTKLVNAAIGQSLLSKKKGTPNVNPIRAIRNAATGLTNVSKALSVVGSDDLMNAVYLRQTEKVPSFLEGENNKRELLIQTAIRISTNTRDRDGVNLFANEYKTTAAEIDVRDYYDEDDEDDEGNEENEGGMNALCCAALAPFLQLKFL